MTIAGSTKFTAEPRSHSGSCPRIVESASCSLECRVDNDCSSNEKCCYNGCGLSCLPAESEESIRRNDEKIGKCAKIVSENSTCAGSRKDVCERDTDCDGVQKCCEQKCGKTCVYAQVTTGQLSQAIAVIRLTVTFVGTREVYRAPNCERPRSCPLISCTQHCPLGFDKDEDGCERCRCRDPCRDVRCPQWHVCRLTQQQCLNGDCDPIPKCVLNACPKGDPLISQDTQLLRVCDISADQRCPVGYFCHRIGIDSATTVILLCYDIRLVLSEYGFKNRHYPHHSVQQFCQRLNQNRLAVLLNAVKAAIARMVLVASMVVEQLVLRLQRQCWCVDVHSGEELLGTRISSLAVQPNCNGDMKSDLTAPKVCATTCGDVKCDFGVRLDRSGCPLNDLCECKSPCEDVKCSNSNDICVLKQMQCLSKPCPPIPICKPNPCAGESRALNDAKGNVQMCSHDRSCNEGHCTFLKDENNLGVCCKSETFMTHFAKTKKLGECPTDLRRHNESTSAGYRLFAIQIFQGCKCYMVVGLV
ncbi:unnamed protein product [Toxocara canis]|uniref:WAP domain-containing protein n=1 Tax=Toxocara canis TaxID=6265 RepID=A0A183VB65_TOXCA|nr:unnamed protein product [Toxocara canis]